MYEDAKKAKVVGEIFELLCLLENKANELTVNIEELCVDLEPVLYAEPPTKESGVDTNQIYKSPLGHRLSDVIDRIEKANTIVNRMLSRLSL